MASFGFSVGDFITCLSLIRQVTQALKDSNGSVADYKSFLQTLNSLNQTFTTSELIYLQWQTRPSGPTYESNTVAMVNGILFERQQCKNLMECFLKASAPYADAFLGRRQKAVVRGWRKVTWLFQKEEISDIQGHMRAMQIYADALFQSLTTQSRLPISLGYPWEASSALTDNLLLCDANGRSVLLPMLFLSSPQQFHELLNIMYRGIPGHQKICRKEYTITDEDADGVLVEESNWTSIVKAGIQLSLNIVLQADPSWKAQHCPQCEEPTLGHVLPNKRRRCHKCQLTYRVFERERLVEEQIATPLLDLVESTAPPNDLRETSPEPRQATKRKEQAYIREKYHFKRVHYYREIEVIKPGSVITLAAEPEPHTLVVEQLPALHRAAATGALTELNDRLDAAEEIDEPLPFDIMLEISSEIWYFGGCSPLHLAAFFGKARAIELLLDRGANISVEDWDRSTPLQYSFAGENYGVSMLLLARGADPNTKGNSGESFVHGVCERGITWLLPPLLEYGAILSAKDEQGGNALHPAAYYGQEGMVHALLKQNIGTLISDLDNEGGTPFHDAVRNGSVEIVTALLAHGANPLLPLPDGQTALHIASYRGHCEVAKLLLESICPMVRDNEGDMPLHHACMGNGSERIVQLLLENGADPVCQNDEGISPLHYAVMGEHATVVKQLINCGIIKLLLEAGGMNILEVKDTKGLTPLLLACWNENDKAIKILLSHGADISVQDGDGNAPLYFVAYIGDSELVAIMVDKGADINVQNNNGKSLLHIASDRGHYELTKLLLGLKCQMLPDQDGDMPLHIACLVASETVVQLLLENGAEPSPTNNNRVTPLHYVVFQRNARIAKQLIDAGAATATKDEKDQTPLFLAAADSDTTIIKLLLKAGATKSLETRGPNGLTPLLRACWIKNDEAAKILLLHGADVSVQDGDGDTPLHFAAYMGNCDLAAIMVDKGADVNIQNNNGESPLFIAVKQSCVEIVRVLLSLGANIDTQSETGHTPLDVASALGHTDAFDLLLQNGADIKIRGNDSRTPFFLACAQGHETVAAVLIEAGADINAPEDGGPSVLHVAALGNHVLVVHLLLRVGMDTDLQTIHGLTALHVATREGSFGVVEALLESGVELEIRDETESTALHYACYEDVAHGFEIAEILLRSGADPSARDEEGDTPLDLCNLFGLSSIAALLEHGTSEP